MKHLLPCVFLSLFGLSALSDPTFKPPILPDVKLTPGAVLNVTAKEICVKGYSKAVRNVPKSLKDKVYVEYHIPSTRKAKEYEIDHLISLELGGSNDIKNLWPQSYQTKPWNAHVKDKLENALHADVCAGKADLKAVQGCISKDWIACYKKEFGEEKP